MALSFVFLFSFLLPRNMKVDLQGNYILFCFCEIDYWKENSNLGWEFYYQNESRSFSEWVPKSRVY